jgi:hypothetical protein
LKPGSARLSGRTYNVIEAAANAVGWTVAEAIGQGWSESLLEQAVEVAFRAVGTRGPAGTVYDQTYGCSVGGADDYGYYGYPTVLYGQHHRFGHMGVGADGTIVHHGMGFHHSIDAEG